MNSVLSGFWNINARVLALAQVLLRSFAMYSDMKVGKCHKTQDDAAELDVSDLALPATNGCSKALRKENKVLAHAMTVVFSAYHSI